MDCRPCREGRPALVAAVVTASDWRGPVAALIAIAGGAVLLYDTWTRWRLP